VTQLCKKGKGFERKNGTGQKWKIVINSIFAECRKKCYSRVS